MPTTTFQALKDKRDPLVMVPLNSMVLAHPWTAGASYIPDAFLDSGGQLNTLPAGWQTLGELQKKAGVDITPDRKTNDIGGLGSTAPRRTVVTDEGVNIDFTAQEWRPINLEMFYATDLSDVTVDTATGEWRGHKFASPFQLCWSLIVMAFDGLPGSEVYPFWIFPKTSPTKAGKISLQDGNEIPFPSTLTIYEDGDYVSSDGEVGPLFDFGVTGIGNIALASQAGFLPAPTSISVIPAAVTLATTDQVQLSVHDSNGMDVTHKCGYVSGTTSKATVSATGVVTAVATGTSTVTASYTPPGGSALTDTCAVTVS